MVEILINKGFYKRQFRILKSLNKNAKWANYPSLSMNLMFIFCENRYKAKNEEGYVIQQKSHQLLSINLLKTKRP